MDETLSASRIAGMIDHSLLHPTLTDADLRTGCALAHSLGAATVCVKPYAVREAAALLAGSSTLVCAVASFPHGNAAIPIKITEAAAAADQGAAEIDVVVNIGKVLGGGWDYIREEIRSVNDAVLARGAILKVIFENDFLNDDHIRRLCDICGEARTAFVKTSTGYGFVKRDDGAYTYEGATVHHVRLMRESCPPWVHIKAAGGIRTLDQLLAVRDAGASRIGASATESIVAEARRRFYST
jgi:deoxyribose-phosphate aldolase